MFATTPLYLQRTKEDLRLTDEQYKRYCALFKRNVLPRKVIAYVSLVIRTKDAVGYSVIGEAIADWVRGTPELTGIPLPQGR